MRKMGIGEIAYRLSNAKPVTPIRRFLNLLYLVFVDILLFALGGKSLMKNKGLLLFVAIVTATICYQVYKFFIKPTHYSHPEREEDDDEEYGDGAFEDDDDLFVE